MHEVIQINDEDDYIELFTVLSSLKNKKLIIKKEITKYYKDMEKDFEQRHFSLSAKGIHKIGYDSICPIPGTKLKKTYVTVI